MWEGRLRCYGHVMRVDQDYIGRRVMEMKLPGKRKRGRPKRRFRDIVKEDMGKLVRGRRTFKTGRFGETLYAVEEKSRKKKKKTYSELFRANTTQNQGCGLGLVNSMQYSYAQTQTRTRQKRSESDESDV